MTLAKRYYVCYNIRESNKQCTAHITENQIMEDKIHKFIEEHQMLSTGDHCIVGVSGGADSVCLFLILEALSKEMDITLHVVHVNHLLRGDAADQDEAMVKALCEKNHVPFHVFHMDVQALAKEWKMTVEEAGRTVRYQCFGQVAEGIRKKEKSDSSCRIAVAHNQDDLAETVIMNLLRGTGMAGVSGIPPVRGQIIRPLLCCSRQEIETYLNIHQQPFCVDASNFEMDYSRNKIRHRILPYMKEMNCAAVEHLCNFADVSRQYQVFVDKQVEEWIERNCIDYQSDALKYIVHIDDLQKADHLIENLVLKKLIGLCCGGEKDIGNSHIEEVKKLYCSISGAKIMLPNGAQVVNRYGKLCFCHKEMLPKETESMAPVHINKEGIYPLPNSDEVLVVSYLDKPVHIDLIKKVYTKFIDYDKIRNDIYLRNCVIDDYMVIDSAGSTKKMNRLFSSYKVPQEERKNIPLIASGSEIIWAVGMRIGENYKVDADTTRVICFEIRRKYEGTSGSTD